MAMMMTNRRCLSLLAVGLVAACSVSDASPPTPAPQTASQAPASGTGSVQINGLSNFRQTALVLTDYCRTVNYETDRQAVAQVAITKALEAYAAALPGGLSLDVEPMSLRMRCHSSGLSGLQSYCVADAKVTMIATGKDRSGQAIRVSASKETSDRAQQGFVCISNMPAVTGAVDKALAEGLAEIQNGLTAQTGIPAR